MDALRRRYAETKQADLARYTLLDDLFQKVDDMQKTMERNTFVLVLIDGDCMNFLNELVKRRMTGGDEAAKLLRRAIFEYLSYEEGFKHDQKILIRIYANLRGLSKIYVEKGILPNTAAFSEFILGFNRAHPLCDFIDAGNHKEAADTKLKETLDLYVYNVHCKHIIFGASADNGYASFLSSSFIGTKVSSRLSLLKGPPFSFEFKNILSKFRSTEFSKVFRSDFITNDLVQQQASRRVTEADRTHTQEPMASANTCSSFMTGRLRYVTASSVTSTSVSENTTPLLKSPGFKSRYETSEVQQDSNGSGALTLAEHQHDQSPALSSASSGQQVQVGISKQPTAGDIAAALISSTNERLLQSPKALDFAVVKQTAEQKLGLASDFWGKDEQDEWFLRSKNIIKMAVEDWVERTDNPPPKNATWMLRYFSSGGSPMSIMKRPSSQLWRTHVDSINLESFTPVSIKTPPIGREGPSRIFQNSKGQRIDIPQVLHVNPDLLVGLRNRNPHLCNSYHLIGDCTNIFCPYDHNSSLTDREFETLAYLSRSRRCPRGSLCIDKCINGHMCPNGGNCKHGNECRFAKLHGIDTTVATDLAAS